MTDTYSLIAGRIKTAEAELIRQLNQSLYSDDPPRPKASIGWRAEVRWWFRKMWWRVHDAWDVLRGRAEIC